MKRSLSLAALLAASSFLSSVPVLAAETASQTSQNASLKQSKEQLAPIPPAVQRSIDKLFTLQPEFKKLSINSSFQVENENRFILQLSNGKAEEANNAKERSNASLEFDSRTGALLRFDLQSFEWTSDKYPSRSLTLEAADKFLSQWFGTEGRKQFGEPESNGSGASTTYNDDGTKITWASRHVQFPLLLNGLPVVGDIGPRVDVDAFGHVVSYQYKPIDLSKIVVPKPDSAKPVEDIKRMVTTADSISLNYIEAQPEKYGPPNTEVKTKSVLQYNSSLYPYLHPQTGKLVDMMSGEEAVNQSKPRVFEKNVTLQPKGQPLLARSEKEAKEIIETLFDANGLASKLQLQEEIMHEDQKNSPYQMYQFSTEDHRTYAFMNVDKKTGQVRNASLQLNNGDESQPKAAKVTKEQAFTTALAFLETYAGPTAGQLKWIDYTWEPERLPVWVDKSKLPQGMSPEEPAEYFFSFNELYQDIPVLDRSYQVSINKQTGKVVAFSLAAPKEKLNLPDSKNIVTKEQAIESFLKNEPLKLQYLWPAYFDQMAPAPVLVYGRNFKEGHGYVDAITGEYVLIPFAWDEE
ncbi:YcdB/YcdC domain-containing protein [Aneurinibacillus tyrosinisolvens]|uniref:YcdB/YcdC domain-containing protein n=1 Tax=Aneurinibacillus tyrosinisolvens TaxID=1443435 RepID=UPI00063F4A78|nr:YcdB/YcdC domain-containing protein [Aneurinibacillus tyrosinisolvens]